MPAATDSLAEAFGDLLCAHGETLSFRGASVVGCVDRSPRPNSIPNQVKNDLHNASVIDVAVEHKPKTGNVFTDSLGFRHRVCFVQFLGNRYRCYCDVSEA